jgi:transcription termination factor Rho
LVTARVTDEDSARYEAIMDISAVNIRNRGTAYRKTGWNRFDAAAPPYSADQVRQEREMYSRTFAP